MIFLSSDVALTLEKLLMIHLLFLEFELS
uniref:Uncharacterized protein n=1 Tax=Ciona intestinalis TaxID=7719 RepID=H2XY42_CIOIN